MKGSAVETTSATRSVEENPYRRDRKRVRKEKRKGIFHDETHAKRSHSHHRHKKCSLRHHALRTLTLVSQGARFRHWLPIGLSATNYARWITACPRLPNNFVGLTTTSATGHHDQYQYRYRVKCIKAINALQELSLSAVFYQFEGISRLTRNQQQLANKAEFSPICIANSVLIAEGIEMAEELATRTNIGLNFGQRVQFGQVYLLGRPGPLP